MMALITNASTRCSLSTYPVPGTIVGAGNQTVHKTDAVPALGELTLKCVGF